MNLDNLNKWLTLTANLGVIAGIIFLGFEIQQNTRATEAEVAWAHDSARQEIYYSRAQDPELLQFVLLIRTWDESDFEAFEALRDEADSMFVRASYIVGTEIGFWQSRFITQTSEEEREILEAQIRLNGGYPFYRFYLEAVGENFYRSDFLEFINSILGQDI